MDDEIESPFSKVPQAGAGPSALQDGPFTYERMVQSAGRGSLRGARSWQAWVFQVALAALLVGCCAAVVLRL